MLTVPLIVGLVEGEAEILAVLHIVFVTLPVRETDMVELTEVEVHPDTVPVEQALGVLVTERVPVWHTLSEGVFDEDVEKDEVRVPDPQALTVTLVVEEREPDTVGESVPLKVEEVVCDIDVLTDPDTVEDKHKVGDVLTEVVEDRDPVMVPEVQGEGVIVDVEH